MDFPAKLPLAQTPTPLQLLTRVSDAYSKPYGGPNIWVKRDDLTGCATSGNKIRKLEYTVAAAMDMGCDTIITAGGVQSNHCRTTAIICAQLGLNCHLILRGESPQVADGNLMLDYLAGADITYISNHEFNQREQQIVEDLKQLYARQGQKAHYIPVGASDGYGVWGYVAASKELVADFATHNIAPQHIIVAAGSGGSQAGLMLGNEVFALGTTVWGVNVCDDANYFINKIRADLDHWQSLYPDRYDTTALTANIIEGYVGEGYAKCSEEVFTMIKNVASLEGLILDPVYSAKAFYGMLDQIKQQRFSGASDIIFIHTGGLFGLFPQKDQLAFP